MKKYNHSKTHSWKRTAACAALILSLGVAAVAEGGMAMQGPNQMTGGHQGAMSSNFARGGQDQMPNGFGGQMPGGQSQQGGFAGERGGQNQMPGGFAGQMPGGQSQQGGGQGQTPGSESERPDGQTPGTESERAALPDGQTPGSESERPERPDGQTPGTESERPELPDGQMPGTESERPELPDGQTPGTESERPELPDGQQGGMNFMTPDNGQNQTPNGFGPMGPMNQMGPMGQRGSMGGMQDPTAIVDDLLKNEIITQTEYDAIKAYMDEHAPALPEDGETPELPKDGQLPELPENGETPQLPEEGMTPQAPDTNDATLFDEMLKDEVITQETYDAISAYLDEKAPRGRFDRFRHMADEGVVDEDTGRRIDEYADKAEADEPEAAADDLATEISTLNELLDAGVITSDDYHAMARTFVPSAA